MLSLHALANKKSSHRVLTTLITDTNDKNLYFPSNFSDYPSHLVHHIHCLCEVVEEAVKQLAPVCQNRVYEGILNIVDESGI